MAAPPKYSEIVKFSELKERQPFASSKTGREYALLNGDIIRLYGAKRGELAAEKFLPDDLVYIHIQPEGAIN
jgi:hypothetical protein